MTLDNYSRRSFTEKELCELLYEQPDRNVCNLPLVDASKHNSAVKANYSELCPITELDRLDILPNEYHKLNQSRWHMPDEYANMDIAAHVLSMCNDQAELQRCGMELLEYQSRGLLPLLCYVKYLVDTMRANGIVWGVGRGSSVASFVLYKLDAHRINSLEYDLDFYEFMR